MPWKHVRYYNSFSQAHSLIYSVIGVQELNLNFFYNKTYWATACLTVEKVLVPIMEKWQKLFIVLKIME